MSEDPHVKAMLGLDIKHFDGFNHHEYRIAGAVMIATSFFICGIVYLVYRLILDTRTENDEDHDQTEMLGSRSDVKNLVTISNPDFN
jgi:hypothetical protein